eukprot:1216799-Amphidinium_carterae.1
MSLRREDAATPNPIGVLPCLCDVQPPPADQRGLLFPLVLFSVPTTKQKRSQLWGRSSNWGALPTKLKR